MRPPKQLACLAILAVLAVGVIVSPAASASVYTDHQGHYHFSYPDAWTALSVGGSDAAYNGTTVAGAAPTVVASHTKENHATDNASWLLTYAQDAFVQVNASVNATEIQAPRTFTTAGGRLAADFVFEHNVSGVPWRERQVFFVSDVVNQAATLALSDNASTYASHEADWASIVESFAFDGEPEIPANLAITIDGGNNTTVAPNATVRFALNQTLPGGLNIEWFRNGTSVGNGTHVDVPLGEGQYVISVQISNATAMRMLTTTVTAGTAPPASTPPPSGGTTTGGSSMLLPLLVALIAIGAVAGLYLLVIRPKKHKPAVPSEGAPPASSDAPPGPPKSE